VQQELKVQLVVKALKEHKVAKVLKVLEVQ
jgi:hypothetical protein